MRAVGRSSSPHRAFLLGRHTFEMAAVESSAKYVVEGPIDDDTTGKELAVPDFDLQSYTLKQSGSPFSRSTTSEIRSAPFLRLMGTSSWSL